MGKLALLFTFQSGSSSDSARASADFPLPFEPTNAQLSPAFNVSRGNCSVLCRQDETCLAKFATMTFYIPFCAAITDRGYVFHNKLSTRLAGVAIITLSAIKVGRDILSFAEEKLLHLPALWHSVCRRVAPLILRAAQYD